MYRHSGASQPQQRTEDGLTRLKERKESASPVLSSHYPGWCLRFETDSPGPPIQALDLVGQNDPREVAGGRKGDLKGIALVSGGDGTEQGEAGFPIVTSRAQRQGRAASGLVMAGLRIAGQPHDFPVSGDVGPLYHASLPWVGPVSTSGCRFSSVTVASMSAKL